MSRVMIRQHCPRSGQKRGNIGSQMFTLKFIVSFPSGLVYLYIHVKCLQSYSAITRKILRKPICYNLPISVISLYWTLPGNFASVLTNENFERLDKAFFRELRHFVPLDKSTLYQNVQNQYLYTQCRVVFESEEKLMSPILLFCAYLM